MKVLKRICLFLMGVILLIVSIGGLVIFRDRKVEPIVETKKTERVEKKKETSASSFKDVETKEIDRRLNNIEIVEPEQTKEQIIETPKAPETSAIKESEVIEQETTDKIEEPQKQSKRAEMTRDDAFSLAVGASVGNKVMWNGEDDEFFYFDAYEDMETHYSIVETIKVDKKNWVAHISEVG